MQSKKLILIVAISFVFGTCTGSVGIAVLASSAGRLHLEIVRHAFVADMNALLNEAWQAGDYRSSLAYASCVVEAEYGKGSRTFNSARSTWPLTFPFAAPVLNAIKKSNITPKGLASDEAVSRARLGVVWEHVGRSDWANMEYAEAVKLTGGSDVTKWRNLGEELLKQKAP